MIIFFENARIRFFKLVISIVNNTEIVQETGTKSAQFSVQNVTITFILFKFHRSIDNSNNFYLVTKRLAVTENSVVKIQNLVMNHKSRPVKSNPGVFNELYDTKFFSLL